MATMEEQLLEKIEAQKAENQQLREKLEITQSVVDEIALGGL